MSAEFWELVREWAGLVAGFLAVGIAWWYGRRADIRAREANALAKRANETADAANDAAHDANRIAMDANDIARAALGVQQGQVDAAEREALERQRERRLQTVSEHRGHCHQLFFGGENQMFDRSKPAIEIYDDYMKQGGPSRYSHLRLVAQIHRELLPALLDFWRFDREHPTPRETLKRHIDAEMAVTVLQLLRPLEERKHPDKSGLPDDFVLWLQNLHPDAIKPRARPK